MASANQKKSKKSKPKTVSLDEFLAGNNKATNTSIGVVTVKKNWADVDDDEEEGVRAPDVSQTYVLPRAPQSEEVDLSRVPDKPPYTIRIQNLSYDAEDAQLEQFFSHLAVSDIRIMREDGRHKGYGFVEFKTRESLIDALHMNKKDLCNRSVRIEVSTGSSNASSRYTERTGDGRRPERNNATGEGDADNDWRSSAAANRETLGFGRDFDSGYGGRRGYENREGGRGFDSRDGGRGFEHRDGGRGFEHRDGGYGGRRGYEGRNGYERESDSSADWSRNSNREFDRQPSSEPPKERQRLNLKPRSKPIDSADTKQDVPHSSAIFGAAKPVDTASKEREIDERLIHESDHHGHGPSRDARFGARDIRTDVERRIYTSSDQQAHTIEKPTEPSKSETDTKSKSSASIFGAAKPVNTAARDREIEEKLKDRNQSDSAAESSKHSTRASRTEASGGSKSAWNKGQSNNQPATAGNKAPVKPVEKKEKRLPQSVDEMPKFKEDKSKDFSDRNIFSNLGDEGGDVDDDKDEDE